MIHRLFSTLFKRATPFVPLSPPTVPTTPTAQAAQASLKAAMTSSSPSTQFQLATVASGCFWGTEHIYRQHYGKGKGLIDAKVGFIGGLESSKNPTYEEVCTGRTGHAEATQIKFDPAKVSYAELVEFFYRTHDPTQLNFQGPDRGTQYRSAIFAHDDEQLEIANKVTAEVQAKHFDPKGQKIVTQIEKRAAQDFFEADAYHQEYLARTPGGYHCPTHVLHW